jgi:hypothetical protein
MHLTQCEWDRLEPCFEQPPELLDDLLCEEEGAFYAHWQRQMNGGLAALHNRAQRQIEALEASTTSLTRNIDLQIADLQRRRRMPDTTVEARTTFAEIIVELEADRDQAIARLAQQRAALRRKADAAEEALWQRTDVLIEVEPLCLVRWRAKQSETVADLLYPDRHGTGGVSLFGLHVAETRLLAERQAREAAEAKLQAAQARERLHLKAAEALEKHQREELLKAAAKQTKLAQRQAPSLRANQILKPPSAPQPDKVAAPDRQRHSKLHLERDFLMATRDRLEVEGRRFLPGSPKTLRNQKARDELTRRIAAIEAKIAARAVKLPPTERPDTERSSWTAKQVEMLRRLWMAGESAADIGRIIGGVSRNAVIGKAGRLGLPTRAHADIRAATTSENELTAASEAAQTTATQIQHQSKGNIPSSVVAHGDRGAGRQIKPELDVGTPADASTSAVAQRRARLMTRLQQLEKRARNLQPNSRGYHSNLEERALIASRISAMEGVGSTPRTPFKIQDKIPSSQSTGVEPSTDPERGWSEDSVALLKQLWAEGVSPDEIASAIGGVTRNRVIGKAHRLGLPSRQQARHDDVEQRATDTPSWQQDEIELLRRLWAEGTPATTIAKTLGRFTRNAVIGKAKRLGLPVNVRNDMDARQSPQTELAAET